jgi:hypothetical protein
MSLSAPVMEGNERGVDGTAKIIGKEKRTRRATCLHGTDGGAQQAAAAKGGDTSGGKG